MPLSRRQILMTATAALLLPRGARAEGVLSGPAFGSHWHANVPNAAQHDLVARIIAGIVADIDAGFSPYLPASDLSRFNVAEVNAWTEMPPEVLGLVDHGLRLNARTAGAFDPTVGPIVQRYGFGPIRGQSGDVAAIETRADALRKTAPGLTLDLCGLAKGHALDRMIAALATAGVVDLMLELGGEVRCLGRHPTGRAWQIAVEDPRPGRGGYHRIVAPGPKGLATSGHAAQGFGGTTHLIDPRQDRPADTRLASVTVLSDTAREADGLATALAALGPEDGPAFAEAENLDALFVLNDGPGLADIITGRFADHILA